MPLKVDDQIPRSVMFLCLGTAMVLLLTQWGKQWADSAGLFTPRLTPRPMGIVRSDRKQNSTPVISRSASPANPSSTKVTPKTDARLVVDLSDRKVTLYKGTQAQAHYPLAVAQAGWETPTGTFQVLAMEQDPTWIHPITGEEVAPGADNPLGVAWIGFWTDGESEIGFHGTNQEELIGEAVSHGCLRMRNADIEAIYSQVSTGTPVIVQQ
ncbi:MAG: L,D-transpeptidase [Leptolyngbyaceae cyanobacterium bins.302]|nr:L,D-transpeptidase [Leptolyngbyaceae cyanobacterium bins.302]